MLMLFKDVYNCPCIACVFEKPFLFGQNTRRFSTVYNTLTIRMLYNLLRKTMQNHMKKRCNLYWITLQLHSF